MGKLSLNTAEGTRIELTKKQQDRIRRLYKRVSKEIGEQAQKIPSTNSEALRQQYLKKIQDQVNEQLEKIGQEIEGTITQTMTQVAADVVSDNLKWMESVGMPVGGAFSHVPDEIVRAVTSGKVYAGKWSLSKAIWGNTQKTQEDINTVIAEGIAQNKSAYDIAKDLEKYVNPSAKKDWSWSKVYPGTNKKVDYNAQRLARTLVSHAYQQAFVRTTKNNPFVTKYKWLGSNSHRICPICEARNGKLFEKDDLPLDHPNGMCTFVAVIEDSMEDIANRLGDWAKGKEDHELDVYVGYIYVGEMPKKGLPPIPELYKSTPQYFTRVGQFATGTERRWNDQSHEVTKKDLKFLQGVTGYVQSMNSFDINSALRANPGKLPKEIFSKGSLEEKIVKTLDKTISDSTLSHEGLVYRFMEESALSAVYGTSDVLSLIGKVTSDPAYLSTSANETLNKYSEYKVKRVIYVESGTSGYITKNWTESEIIFARNTKTVVESAKIDGDNITIYERMIKINDKEK